MTFTENVYERSQFDNNDDPFLGIQYLLEPMTQVFNSLVVSMKVIQPIKEEEFLNNVRFGTMMTEGSNSTFHMNGHCLFRANKSPTLGSQLHTTGK